MVSREVVARVAVDALGRVTLQAYFTALTVTSGATATRQEVARLALETGSSVAVYAVGRSRIAFLAQQGYIEEITSHTLSAGGGCTFETAIRTHVAWTTHSGRRQKVAGLALYASDSGVGADLASQIQGRTENASAV